jgi:hypothetical protein
MLLLLLLLSLFAAVALAPLFAQGWRAWLIVAGGLGAVIAYFWIDAAMARMRPDYDFDPGLGGAIAISLGQLTTVGFLATAAARLVGLILQGHGLSRGEVWWTDALALAAILAFLLE